ncbi:MAG TPA: Xaa-Pro peptidase family protein [Candidatus Limnocylindria bacterium]|nr:Xaa-Pro peptidase family protein [Candidatus Limnocylindria bacterium]
MTAAAHPTRFAVDVYRGRLQRAAAEAASRDVGALLITPSTDYAYLLGYAAPGFERLTCLVLSADGRASLVVPRLEEPLARHELGELAGDLAIIPWDETEDPFWVVRDLLDAGVMRAAVQDQMWARFVLRLRAALDPIELVEAGPSLAALRRIKSAEEIDRLRAAARAADEAMDRIRGTRFSGRTEREVSLEIRDLLVAAGHESADFAIVASGPNSASPHHDPGDRVIEAGDALVLDIGGFRAGYGSDTTRTVFVGDPPSEFSELYAVLHEAQAAACTAIRPGVAAQEIDRAARGVIAAAGFGASFIHRTGHGIGMETHEEPYIVEGNADPLLPGDAFSIEPGIYLAGRWGARIEDIAICTDDGGEILNQSSRELLVVE